MNMRKVALVVDAQSLIGCDLISHLRGLEDWFVIGLSPHGGESCGRLQHIAVDLLNQEDVRAKLCGLKQVTHIFYAACLHRSALAMLINTLENIEAVADDLQHVSLLQADQAHDGHLVSHNMPDESATHLMEPECLFDQQRYLQQRQQGKSWTWSGIRPGWPAALHWIIR